MRTNECIKHVRGEEKLHCLFAVFNREIIPTVAVTLTVFAVAVLRLLCYLSRDHIRMTISIKIP